MSDTWSRRFQPCGSTSIIVLKLESRWNIHATEMLVAVTGSIFGFSTCERAWALQFCHIPPLVGGVKASKYPVIRRFLFYSSDDGISKVDARRF